MPNSVIGAIARYEFSQLLRSRQFWFVGTVFAAMAFIIMLYAGDIAGGGNINTNAPNNIILFVNILSFFALFLVASMVANSVTRDFELDSWQVVFSYPVPWWSYLLGRFSGSLLAAVLCYAFVIPGLILGVHGPWSDGEVGPFKFSHYLYALLVLAVPNLFVMSAILFTLSTLMRKSLYAYAGAVLLFVLYNVGYAALNQESAEPYVFLVDLFGLNTLNLVTRYWTPAELNTQLVPVTGMFLWNRLLWIAVGVALMAWTLFRFNPYPTSSKLKASVETEAVRTVETRPIAPQVQDGTTVWQQFFERVQLEVWAVVRSIPFLVLVVLGFTNSWLYATLVDPVFGSPPMALTRVVVGALDIGLTLPLLIVAAYYAGELVWRERQVRLDQIVDAMPVRNSVFLFSKLLSLWLIILVLLAATALGMVFVQLVKGTPIDAGMYFKELGYAALPFVWISVLALSVQVVSPNKYVGVLLMVIYIAITLAAPAMVDAMNLWVFGTHPDSEISGLANSTWYRLEGLKYDLYWGALSAALVILAALLWPRGTDTGLRSQWKSARRTATPLQVGALAVSLVAFALIGRWLYVEDFIDNPLPPGAKAEADRQVSYEKLMRPLENKPVPILKSVKLDLATDIPSRTASARGELRVSNDSAEPFETFYVGTSLLAKRNQLTVEGAVRDEDFPADGFTRYRFEPPMQPGESRTVTFDLDLDFGHFPGGQARLETSGTSLFLSDVIPDVMGYSPFGAMSDPRKRKEHGLPPDAAHIATLDEAWGRDYNALFGQGDQIDFDGTYSVNKGQVAFMGGELVKSWDEGDRSYFHYKSETPISIALTLQQGEYDVVRDSAAGVNLAIYYHPTDDYHVAEFMKNFKIAVDYFTREFGAFPYPEFRLIQKAHGRGANSNSGQLTFGEFAGFVSDLQKDTSVDWGTHVIGHEAGHNWWGIMAPSAKSEGSHVLQETLAQYSGLMTLERSYDKAMVARFLRYSIKQYHGDRNTSQFAEVPLYRSRQETDYVHYWKGAPVMYGVKELIGEKALNAALRNYFTEWKFASGPYPTTLDLLKELRAQTPPEYQDTLTDYFERILMHDLSVTDAAVEQMSDGRYKVTATIRTRKLERTPEGAETQVAIHEPVQLVVVDDEINRSDRYNAGWLAERRQWITAEETEVEFIVAEVPAALVVDPYHNFIERNLDDNVRMLDRAD
jgi:ABC-2 type transport system permease protein